MYIFILEFFKSALFIREMLSISEHDSQLVKSGKTFIYT